MLINGTSAMHVSLFKHGISAYILFLIGHNTLHVPVSSVRSLAPLILKKDNWIFLLNIC